MRTSDSTGDRIIVVLLLFSRPFFLVCARAMRSSEARDLTDLDLTNQNSKSNVDIR
jgi:hypothetical protein